MPEFNTNPNQKIINILKDGKAKCDTDHIYLKVQKQAMFNAMNDLTPTNFLVWLYLASQADNYMFAFSPVAIAAETGLKKTSLQAGIRTLIDGKYLIQRENSNIFDFYEEPYDPEAKEDIQICTHTSNKVADKNVNDDFKF